MGVATLVDLPGRLVDGRSEPARRLLCVRDVELMGPASTDLAGGSYLNRQSELAMSRNASPAPARLF